MLLNTTLFPIKEADDDAEMDFLESETREADDESGFHDLNATYVWNPESFNVTAGELSLGLSSTCSGRNPTLVSTKTSSNTQNRRLQNSTFSSTPSNTATNNANTLVAAASTSAAVAVGACTGDASSTIADAAVRASVSGAVIEEMVSIPTSHPPPPTPATATTSTTITVVSSLLGKRNRDRSGFGRSAAFIDCLDVIERQLEMQPAEVNLFDERFIEFYKMYRDMVIQFEEMGTSDPPDAVNMAQRDASSPFNVSTTEVSSTGTTSHLHESLMKKRSALELEHKRLMEKSEMVFAAIAGIDEVLEVRRSSAYAQEGRMRNLLRQMLLTQCLSFMSGYVKIRRDLRK